MPVFGCSATGGSGRVRLCVRAGLEVGNASRTSRGQLSDRGCRGVRCRVGEQVLVPSGGPGLCCVDGPHVRVSLSEFLAVLRREAAEVGVGGADGCVRLLGLVVYPAAVVGHGGQTGVGAWCVVGGDEPADRSGPGPVRVRGDQRSERRQSGSGGSAIVGCASEAARPARPRLVRAAPHGWPVGARGAAAARGPRCRRCGRVLRRHVDVSGPSDCVGDAARRSPRRRGPLAAPGRR